MAVSDEVARRNWRRPLTGVAVVAVIGAGLGAYLGIRVAQGAGSAPATGQPPARTEAAMAYDAADGTLVLFGGEGRSGSLGDTWTWDGSAWTQVHPSTSPPPLAGAKMAYDPVSHDLVLTGGARIQGSPFDGGVACSSVGSSGSGSGSSGSTSTGTASFIPPSKAIPAIAPVPSSTGGAATSGSSATVIADCSVTDMQNTATWLWNGSDWSEAAGKSPAAGYGDWSLATDPVTGRVLLLAPQPFIAEPGVAAPAPEIACPVQVNGNLHVVEPGCPFYPAPDPTWTWNGHAWTALKAPAGGRSLPFGALGTSVVADPVTGKLAVFRSDLVAVPVTCGPAGPAACTPGSNASTAAVCCSGTVSVWDGTGWKQTSTFKNGPLMTSAGTLVGDPTAHGDLYLTADGQTWLWTGVWTREHPSRTPVDLNGSVAAYDATSRQVVLFGGLGLSERAHGLYDQTWTWDSTTWTQRGGSASAAVNIPIPSPVSVPPYSPSCSMPPVVKPAPEPAIACPMIPAGVSGGSRSGSSGSSGASGAAGSPPGRP
jgi:Galactose oxidase, central domain